VRSKAGLNRRHIDFQSIALPLSYLNKNNQFQIQEYSDTINVLKAKRKILTTLIHSCDAKIILNLRKILKEKYNQNTCTIHDGIWLCPSIYEKAVIEYKKLLKKLIFDRK
jgi:hypothetical protein